MLPDHRCARGCGRLVYFEGDLCGPAASDAIRAITAGVCYPRPETEPQIKAEMKRILALAKARENA